ncbi:O-antigen ligase family protein [Dongia soli]|uniref:O-antigen ligase-related domain-containing protein n=1 Tax=Dongia soli TaxID=600628 RepID=A0ABU5EH28_9PROT|nr:O-antigen ligase family protein [Dongia soli]MDY0885647.1 hypothetical protein [Dongia soli]
MTPSTVTISPRSSKAGRNPPRSRPPRNLTPAERVDPTEAPLGIADKLGLSGLALYILLKPFYMLPSGLPQVGDFLLIIMLTLLAFQRRVYFSKEARAFTGWMVLFAVHATVVNVTWSAILADKKVMLYAAYYVFNVGLVILCLRYGFLKPKVTLVVIAYATTASVVLQAGASFLADKEEMIRQTISFNNPNQLGYWSLLSLCIFLSIANRLKFPWYMQTLVPICLCYTVALSLSKAAMLASVLTIFIHVVKNRKMLVIAIVLAGIGYVALEKSAIVDHVTNRIDNIGQQYDDSFYARGYLRIIAWPQYVLLGAGEGAIYRWDDSEYSDDRFEIHSTMATILFSYGLVGLTLFLSAIWCIYRGTSLGQFLYVLPPFLYGITHQGLRFSLFWLLFAVVLVLGSIREKGGRQQEGAKKA